MDKIKVATSAATSYEPQTVQSAVDDILSQLGGMEKYVPKDAKVFVKVNLVRDMPPEKCGTTHPQVVIALVNRLSAITQNIVVGDSSGGLYTKAAMGSVYAKCKMTAVAEQTCATLNDDFDFAVAEIGGNNSPGNSIFSIRIVPYSTPRSVATMTPSSFATFSPFGST